MRFTFLLLFLPACQIQEGESGPLPFASGTTTFNTTFGVASSTAGSDGAEVTGNTLAFSLGLLSTDGTAETN